MNRATQRDEMPPTVRESTPASFLLTRVRCVLVVDDNRDSANSLTLLLRLAGHDVETAYEGEAALEAARRRRPDVVLLDIGLPLLDGYTLARRIRQDLGMRNTLLIATTGYGKDEDRKSSQEAGFDAHLVKPIDLEELRQIMAGFAAGLVGPRD